MATERTLPQATAASAPANAPLRILIVRIGAMGDVLHALPAVAALRERHPDCFLAWAIEPRWRELLESPGEFDRTGGSGKRSAGKPLVDVCIPVPAQQWKERPFALATLSEISGLRRELRGWKFDLCVDMQGSIKSAVTGRMAQAEMFVGAAEPRERQAEWLYGRKIPVHAKHVIAQGCELLSAALGETLAPDKVTMPVDEEAERWCDSLLAATVPHGERFVFLAPTAGWGAKQWPAQRFGAVAAALGRAGFRTLVNRPPGDRSAAEVLEASGGAATLVPCSVSQMVSLVRRATLVIAGDTGPLHLAAALERPVVALFGPTDPARNGPYGTRAIVLRHPSSHINHKRLRDTEPGLLRITVDDVVEAALKLLQEAHTGELDGEQDKVNR